MKFTSTEQQLIELTLMARRYKISLNTDNEASESFHRLKDGMSGRGLYEVLMYCKRMEYGKSR